MLGSKQITRVHILTRLGSGGPPVHVINVMRALMARGFPSVLITGRTSGDDSDMSYLLSGNDCVHWVPQMSRNPSFWNDARALLAIYRILRRTRPQIVHTHTAKAGTLGRIAARLAGVPCIVHTYHGNVMKHYFSPRVSRLITLWERQLGRLTDMICALSPQQAAELSDELGVVPRAKIRVVPLGLDLLRFASPPTPPGNEFVVGWLGRFVAIKNIALLADTIREATARSAAIRFVVAGAGPEGGILESLRDVVGAERLEILPWQQDVQPLLSRLHAMVLTSRNEGTPLSLIEGLAAGLPFVSTAAGGVVDLTGSPCPQPPGEAPLWRRFEHGYLAGPRPDALAGALVHLSRHQEIWSEMSQTGRRFAHSAFSLDRLAGDLENVYTSLLDRNFAPAAAGLAATGAAPEPASLDPS
jgi:glycosyltransferase involved in cell wall biosynthesis